MWLGLGIRITNWWRTLAANGPFNNHATLTDGLVSYWKLDEQSGVRYDSITASANDLTDNNTVTYVNAGPDEVVASFVQANNEFLSSSYSPGANATYTTVAWHRPSATGIGGAEEVVAGGSGDFILRTNIDSVNLLTSGFGVSNNINGVVVSNQWGMLAGYYEHGVGSGVSYNASAWQTAADVANGTWTGTFIGARDAIPTDVTEVDGEIARVGIWSRVLTNDEIASIYNTGAGKLYADLTDAEKVGLVSYWNLNEESGVRSDSHGSNDLTDNNTVLSATNAVPPPKNIAAQFTAANSEYLSLSAGLAALDDQFTISGWIYRNLSTLSGWVFNGTSATDMGLRAALNLVGEGDILVYVPANATDAVTYGYTATGVIPATTWTSVVITYDGTQAVNADRLRIYINNSNMALTRAGTHPASVKVGGGFWIGREGDTTSYYTGRFDETGIWSRVLTAQERTDLYNSGAGLFY